MSWSLNLIGKKADVQACVKAQIVDNGYAPELGNAIIAEIASIPEPPIPTKGGWGASDVIVIGNGYKGGGVNALKIEPFTPCYAPPQPQPPQPAS